MFLLNVFPGLVGSLVTGQPKPGEVSRVRFLSMISRHRPRGGGYDFVMLDDLQRCTPEKKTWIPKMTPYLKGDTF